MTRIMFSGDYHIGSSKRYKTYQEDVRKGLQFVIDKAISYEVTHFICGGDALDSATRIPNADLLFLSDALGTLEKESKILWLIGNHDYHSYPIMGIFKRFISYLIDRGNYLNVSPIVITPNVEILMVPHLYFNDPLPIFPKIRNRKRIVVTHQAIELGENRKANVEVTYERSQGSQRIFSRDEIQRLSADVVFCGHIHIHMEYSLNGIPIYYPGATCILNFGEVNSGNGFYIIDIDNSDLQVSYYEIPQRKWVITNKVPDSIEPDTIYRLEVPEDKIDTLQALRFHFNELNSEVFFKVNPSNRTQPIRIEGIVDVDDITKLHLWLKHKGIMDTEPYIMEYKKLIGGLDDK